MPVQQSQKKSLYNKRRYWYHISSTLKKKEVHLVPWDDDKSFNRGPMEPNVERICVAPSIAHCLTALPYCPGDTYYVYKTKNPVKANPPHEVFDSNVTKEGWIQRPTTFVKLGVFTLEDVERYEKVKRIIGEAASGDDPRQSGRVLAWWRKRKTRRYLKQRA